MLFISWSKVWHYIPPQDKGLNSIASPRFLLISFKFSINVLAIVGTLLHDVKVSSRGTFGTEILFLKTPLSSLPKHFRWVLDQWNKQAGSNGDTILKKKFLCCEQQLSCWKLQMLLNSPTQPEASQFQGRKSCKKIMCFMSSRTFLPRL